MCNASYASVEQYYIKWAVGEKSVCSFMGSKIRGDQLSIICMTEKDVGESSLGASGNNFWSCI